MTGEDGEKNLLKVWDADTGEEQWAVRVLDWGGPNVEFSPDGSQLLTCVYTHSPQVWDASTGEAIFGGYEAEAPDFTSGIFPPVCLYYDWSPSGDRFVLAGWDLRAIVWDATTYEQLVVFTNHTDGIDDVNWSPVGDRIVTSDEEGIVKIWDANTGAELLSFRASPEFVFRVAWSPDGKHVVTADGGLLSATVWRVWPTLDDLVDYAYECCVVRTLTQEERLQFGLQPAEGQEPPEEETGRVPVSLYAASFGLASVGLVVARRRLMRYRQ